MEKIYITLSLFFEIKGSEMFDGGIGYSEFRVDFYGKDLRNVKLQDCAEEQRKGVAKMSNVPLQNVKIISRNKYEEKTEDD